METQAYRNDLFFNSASSGDSKPARRVRIQWLELRNSGRNKFASLRLVNVTCVMFARH